MEPQSKVQSATSIYLQSVAAIAGLNFLALGSWQLKPGIVVNLEPALQKPAASIFDFVIISSLILGNISLLGLSALKIRNSLENLHDCK